MVDFNADFIKGLPAPVAAPQALVEQCVSKSSEIFNVPVSVIKSILAVEGGKIGTLSRNKNGSYDMGLMQINTVNLNRINKKFPSVGWKQLTYSPCINIGVGTWMLSEHIKEAPNMWIGVGNYHSKTPRYRTIYLRKIASAYKRIVSKG